MFFRQAILLAGIFEFLGALLLGKHVTKTIREGIANVSSVYTTNNECMYLHTITGDNIK